MVCREEYPRTPLCIPRDVLKHAKAVAAKAEQSNLDEMFQSKPTEFSRDGVLRAVAEFVVCDNQVCGAAVCLQCGYHTY